MESTFSNLLSDTLGQAAPLNTNIHPNDQMYRFVASSRGSEPVARSEYFTSGVQLLNTLEQLVQWKFGSFERLPSFLDFAGGYGRLTRFLVHRLPPDRIWVSDIQEDAVAFQQAEFGVHGFVSTVDPDALPCDRTFDCIFVASLFSHLPPATFTPWLKKLYSMLAPGGLLAISAIPEDRLPAGLAMPESGIWFNEASEIASLDTKDYGLSMVTEPFMREAIAAATGRPAYARLRHALHYYQDIYLLVNEPSPDFPGLHFAYMPHGTIEHALFTGPGELRLKGWVVGMEGPDAPTEIQVFVDGEPRQECPPSTHRPDLQEHFNDDRFLYTGWECTCQLPNNDPTQVLAVKCISASGAESLLYLGTIASVMPQGKLELCRWTGPGELYVKGWAAGTEEPDSPTEIQVFVDDQLRQKCLPSLHRPDLQAHFNDDRFLYAGWECTCRLPNDDPSQVLAVKKLSPGGAESLLYLGTIAFILSPSPPETDVPADEVEQQRRALQEMEADLGRRLEYIKHLEAEIARKNAALAALETRLSRIEQRRTRLRWPRWPWRRRSPFR